MNIKPLGFYVLIEMEVVEKTSKGGVILLDDMVNKEQEATNIGYVRAIGPTAYVGYPGCDEFETASIDKDSLIGAAINKTYPADCWGLKIGQKIEYRRFEGKTSAVPGYENYRYIPDSHIIGAVE